MTDSMFSTPVAMEKPTCAVCKVPVKYMRVSHDPRSCMRSFVLRCHGAEERFEVSDYFVAMRPTTGEAFAGATTPALLPAARALPEAP